MRPELQSYKLFGITRSKAKMLEYRVPVEHHIAMPQDPAELFVLSISFLGDQAARSSRGELEQSEQEQLKSNLMFSARFFDSYLQTELQQSLDPYLILLGAASYYLCDLPGSASVLAQKLGDGCPDLEGGGLEALLLWLLQANLSSSFEGCPGLFGSSVDAVSQAILKFFEDGSGKRRLICLAKQLRKKVYEIGNPRQLLLGDIIAAVLNKKIENSCWDALPGYSELPVEKWSPSLRNESFIKELWPAQHLLGKKDVLKGKSAIVQMPTSAGKTKAIELIIRSAFLADRADLAVIVAPFRALCHEIKSNLTEAFQGESIKINEFSDVLQMDVVTMNYTDMPSIPKDLLEALFTDFDISEFEVPKQIVVVTPEKLLYVLRHMPALASNIGLLIFDEGHQFDNGTRGITYELLLTSLRSMIPAEAQKVLISAVINNAEAVGEWLNGNPNVVAGNNLNPTFRSVGFTSWLDRLGRIEYVDSQNIELDEFFVPRIIERLQLRRKPGERTDRFFPDKTDGQGIALYLGLKLVANGGVAIFCGKKSSAAKICKQAVDVFERQIPLASPKNFSNQEEVMRLAYLHMANLGSDSTPSKSAALGIFEHHGNTPHGIRLAVEYAMRKSLIHFVVCTSTLAQGVNLPLRYLLVANVYQGIEKIKVRDFHNLIGRAGRAGIHTEGSILFSDPKIYDKRKIREENMPWKQIKELLNPNNSEPCISNLLSVFEPIKNNTGRHTIEMDALDFAKLYIAEHDSVIQYAKAISDKHGHIGFAQDDIEKQMLWKIDLICAVESFLLAHWDEEDIGLSDKKVIDIAESTLAYFLADRQQQENIKALFQLLAGNISSAITTPEKRKAYGRTLYGVQNSMKIETWLLDSFDGLVSMDDSVSLIDFMWPIFSANIKNRTFNKYDRPDVLKELVAMWISGKPFYMLLQKTHEQGARMINGSQRRDFNIEHMVDICEGGLAFDGALFIGAVCELIDMLEFENSSNLLKRLHTLQKQMQYGLSSEAAIAVYELGFSDRVIAQKLAEDLGIEGDNKGNAIKMIRRHQDAAQKILDSYPAFFQQRLDELITRT